MTPRGYTGGSHAIVTVSRLTDVKRTREGGPGPENEIAKQVTSSCL